MVYQSLDLVGTVHSHGVHEKHLSVKGWHSENALQIRNKFDFNTRDVS